MRPNPWLALAGFVAITAMPISAGLTPAAHAAAYEIDPVHSSVEFRIRHLVSRTSGRFADFSGTIEFDPSAPEAGKVSVSIASASIDTGNEKRDTHLRSADFFDVESYPAITFTGTVSERTDDGFLVTGLLTMRGVEKEITLPVEVLGTGPDGRGSNRAGFATELTLNRKDYGIAWNRALDQGGFLLGDEVAISIAVEAVEAVEQRENAEM